MGTPQKAEAEVPLRAGQEASAKARDTATEKSKDEAAVASKIMLLRSARLKSDQDKATAEIALADAEVRRGYPSLTESIHPSIHPSIRGEEMRGSAVRCGRATEVLMRDVSLRSSCSFTTPHAPPASDQIYPMCLVPLLLG